MLPRLPLRELWQKLLLKVFTRPDEGLPSWVVQIKRKYWAFRDREIGREHVGTDKYGNEYYQHYSYNGGLPTRRMVLYKFVNGHNFHNDPHFFGWLHGKQEKPPTPEQLQYLYLIDAQFKRKGLLWDAEQQTMMAAFNAERTKLEDRERQQIEKATKDTWELEKERPNPQLSEAQKKLLVGSEQQVEVSPVPVPVPELSEMDLKALKEIIHHEEEKLQFYQNQIDERAKYIAEAVRSFNKHDDFREKFKDVFFELEMKDAKNDYSLVEKDPDIMIVPQNQHPSQLPEPPV